MCPLKRGTIVFGGTSLFHIVGFQTSWDKLKCPNLRGGLILGSEVLHTNCYLGHTQVSLIQKFPHFRGLEWEGFYCIQRCLHFRWLE